MSKEEINKSQALGAIFTEMSDKEKKELNIAYGVKIKSIGAGKLKSIGLMEGDVILKVNNEPIESIEQLSGKLSGVNRGVLLEIMTESGKREYKGLGL
jgi:S1-C subfamily serine protease